MLVQFPKIGILGGGQLGKMLIDQANKWSVPLSVMDFDSNAVCKNHCTDFKVGDLMDYKTVIDFGSKLSIVTIEIEKVNVDALKFLEKNKVKVYPQSKVLEIVQNKVKQKEFYKNNGIATSDFQSFKTKSDLIRSIIQNETKLPFIWKASRFGYDGYGVKKINKISELEPLDNGECLAEEYIDIVKELSVIICRNHSGETSCFPVVEMIFNPKSNQVEYILCPPRISEKIKSEATDLAKKVSESFQHIGLLAVELFLDRKQRLLVNEVAPRPHNSGHWSIEGAYSSQYQQLLRALLNLPLGKPDIISPSVMVNLVGSKKKSGPVIYKNLEKIFQINGAFLHLYGKPISRPNRKMGHITLLDKDLENAYQNAQYLKQTIEISSK
ncbi:MAG: 5-(carboxyamino)imidazole ribonucleotide synthase [Flavobacteriaceae bacterium]|nr:5-(carboxyamino)imidazole ribonucleotide synthase [Flavobacteriaceae bacterium]